MNISLVGKDKAEVLVALYNNSQPLGIGILQHDPAPMKKEEAKEILKEQFDFDYLKGRVMKVNLGGDSFDPWLYDRDNGEGSAARALSHLEGQGK